MILEIHEAAAAEVQHHYDWYHERNPAVANRLAALFESTVLRIVKAPHKFSLMEMRNNPGNIRRARVEGFSPVRSVPTAR
jgi:plasmid stabilization system protein ParE